MRKIPIFIVPYHNKNAQTENYLLSAHPFEKYDSVKDHFNLRKKSQEDYLFQKRYGLNEGDAIQFLHQYKILHKRGI
jgi:butyrate kinase